MSKQDDAKKAQGYHTEPKNCSSCSHLEFKMELPMWMRIENAKDIENGKPAHYGHEYEAAKNLRCGIGNFAVKKTAACEKWE